MMKTKYFILLPLIIVLAWMSAKAFNSSQGPHGGVVKPAGPLYIEVSRKSFSLFTFLLDSTMKPMSNKGTTCEAKLFLPDKTSIDVQLLPFGDDGFWAESVRQYYTSCKITFHTAGKSVSAEFENEVMIVNK